MIRISRRGVVHCAARIDIPLSATAVWGQLRDFPRFAQQDLFHAGLTIEGGVPRAGARLEMMHRYAGFRIRRIGRILIWREGVGFSFSDLSRKGPRHGFPHVLSYRIESIAAERCRLHISVRGLWTSRAPGRPAAWLWLWWVFAQVVRSVERELLLYRIWRERRGARREQRVRS